MLLSPLTDTIVRGDLMALVGEQRELEVRAETARLLGGLLTYATSQHGQM